MKKVFCNFLKGFQEAIKVSDSLLQAWESACGKDNPEGVLEDLKSLSEHEVFWGIVTILQRNVSLGQSFGCPSLSVNVSLNRQVFEYETTGGLSLRSCQEWHGQDEPWVFLLDHKNMVKEPAFAEDVKRLEKGVMERCDVKGSTLKRALLDAGWEE